MLVFLKYPVTSKYDFEDTDYYVEYQDLRHLMYNRGVKGAGQDPRFRS